MNKNDTKVPSEPEWLTKYKNRVIDKPNPDGKLNLVDILEPPDPFVAHTKELDMKTYPDAECLKPTLAGIQTNGVYVATKPNGDTEMLSFQTRGKHQTLRVCPIWYYGSKYSASDEKGNDMSIRQKYETAVYCDQAFPPCECFVNADITQDIAKQGDKQALMLSLSWNLNFMNIVDEYKIQLPLCTGKNTQMYPELTVHRQESNREETLVYKFYPLDFEEIEKEMQKTLSPPKSKRNKRPKQRKQ